jgi:signal transduction histidine kinase
VSITVHNRSGSLNPQFTPNYIKIPSHLSLSINADSDINSEILPRLFTKFATKTDKRTDLGPFISKSIIEAHEGKKWAENNLDGKGATFAFSLPIN